MAVDSLRHDSIKPSHPGEFLAEIVIPGSGKTKTEVAKLLHLSRQTLHDILRARQPVTPSVAAKLGKLFGNGTGFWIRMQAAFDTWQADREVDTSDIPTLKMA